MEGKSRKSRERRKEREEQNRCWSYSGDITAKRYLSRPWGTWVVLKFKGPDSPQLGIAATPRTSGVSKRPEPLSMVGATVHKI